MIFLTTYIAKKIGGEAGMAGEGTESAVKEGKGTCCILMLAICTSKASTKGGLKEE